MFFLHTAISKVKSTNILYPEKIFMKNINFEKTKILKLLFWRQLSQPFTLNNEVLIQFSIDN